MSAPSQVTSDRVTIGLSVGTQPPVKRIRLMTGLARAFRYDVAWTVDHLQGWFPQSIWDRRLSFMADPEGTPHAYLDYQAVLGHLASKAGTMQLAVGVTEPVRRHPVLLAQWAMTLAHLAKRPPILGIGAGEAENTEPYGFDFSRPVGRLEEALQIIRRCFASRGPFDFEGEFFSMRQAMMDLAPPPDRTPQVWIAAHGPRMLRLAGEYGDGWFPTLPYTPQEYADALSTIRGHALAAGRDPGTIVSAWSGLVVLGRTENEARELLDRRAIRFAALLAPAEMWRRYGVEHPLGAEYRGIVEFIPQRYPPDEIEAALAAVPIDIAAESLIWGTPATVEAKLGDMVDAGLRHIVVQPASALASPRHAAYSLWHTSSIVRRIRRQGSDQGVPG